MRLTKTTLALLTLVSITGLSAQSAQAQSDACRSEFTNVHMQDEGFTFPYVAEIEDKLGSFSAETTRTQVSQIHFFDNDGYTLYQSNGVTDSQSTDNGASWTFSPTGRTEESMRTMAYDQRDLASAATNVACTDGVSHDGQTWRLVEGTVGSGEFSLHHRYYRASSGEVMIWESEGNAGGQDFTSEAQKLEFGPSVRIPNHY
ncbi:MAG: hypothetical protein Rhims3KO_19560 [Hyphomicrobiales bacterium]